MSPSTHSADVSQIQSDTAAILVDTGTTIPATIATVDTNVDAVLVDTGTTLPDTLSALRDNPVLTASGDISSSQSSSGSYLDSGMTITVPNVTGKLYTVVAYLPSTSIATTAKNMRFRMVGSTVGNGNQQMQGPAQDDNQTWSPIILTWGGFVPNETVKIQYGSNDNTFVTYMTGGWSMHAFEEA